MRDPFQGTPGGKLKKDCKTKKMQMENKIAVEK